VNLALAVRNSLGNYNASADGKPFLTNTAGEVNSSPIKLVVNWNAELKR